MIKTKLTNLIGMAIKAGKVSFGVDNVIKKLTKVRLIICDTTLSENSFDKIKIKCATHNIAFEYLQTVLISEITYKDKCKLIGIMDESFAHGIVAVIKML